MTATGDLPTLCDCACIIEAMYSVIVASHMLCYTMSYLLDGAVGLFKVRCAGPVPI